MNVYRLLKILWRILRVLAQLVWSFDEVARVVKKVFDDDDEEEDAK